MIKSRLYYGLLPFFLFINGCEATKGCIAKEFMAVVVGDAVIRLLTAGSSLLADRVNSENPNDSAFSFEGPNAKVVIKKSKDPNEYGKGKVIWTLENVSINYPEEKDVYTDCLGKKGFLTGSVEVKKATRTIYGVLTGDPLQPVVPDPGKISVFMEAEVTRDLYIRFSETDKNAYLKIAPGSKISFTGLPRLAQYQTSDDTNEKKGLAVVQTSNLLFKGIKVSDAIVTLYSDDAVVKDIPIKESNFDAQIGLGEDGRENWMEGKITIWNNEHDAPDILDPSYKRDNFIKTFSCREGLTGKDISYKHDGPELELGAGTAALATLLTGEIAYAYNNHEECGFASPGVLRSTTFSAPPGAKGEAVTASEQSCLIKFRNHITKSDCFGVVYEMYGDATVVKAKKKVMGLIASDKENFDKSIDIYAQNLRPGSVKKLIPPEAAIPYMAKPASVELKIKLNNISIKNVCTNQKRTADTYHCKNNNNFKTNKFSVESGQIKAKISPKLAKNIDPNDPFSGTCSVQTPDAKLEITLKNLRAGIQTGSRQLYLPVSGTYKAYSAKNKLKGEVQVRSRDIKFATQNKNFIALNPDPNYELDQFEASFFSCSENKMELVNSDEQCALEPFFANNIARLLVLNAGVLLEYSAKHIRSPTNFAFAIPYADISADRDVYTLPADINNHDLEGLVLLRDIDKQKEANVDGKILGLSMALTIRGKSTIDPDEKEGIVPFDINLVPFDINIKKFRYVEALTVGAGRAMNSITNRFMNYLTGRVIDRPAPPEHIFVRPVASDSTTLKITTAVLKDFSSKMHKIGQEPEGYITIHRGIFEEIEAMPVMANASPEGQPPSFSKQTNEVKFNNIKVSKLMATLHAQGGVTVPFYVREANLQAQNGRINGEDSYIEGSMNLIFVSDIELNPASFGPLITIEHQALEPTEN